MQYISSLLRPDEIVALVKMGYARAGATSGNATAGMAQCYDLLEKTSRSFAFVIQELSPELRDVICIFYLVLRSLDTIEDDMSVAVEKKVPVLIQFHEKLLQPGWNIKGYGEKDEKVLLENFDKVIDRYLTFPEKYQKVIKDIAKRMGAGMAEFCQRPVVTVPDYNLYCHYVAGLVGVGLSDLFVASGLESDWYSTAVDVSNSMGLFLQKVNITRDYLEDINQIPQRMFWPKDIWSQYAPSKLEDFKSPKYAKEAVHCLNHLITDALSHLPDCLDYLGRLNDKTIFNFCAIPQVMAIATLATCYNNHNVFTGVVKIRRGQSAKIMVDIHEKGLTAVYEHFLRFTNLLASKIQKDDPNAKKATQLVVQIRKTCEARVGTPSNFGINDVLAVAAVAASGAYLLTKYNKKDAAKTSETTTGDVAAITTLATSSAYLVAKHNKRLLAKL